MADTHTYKFKYLWLRLIELAKSSIHESLKDEDLDPDECIDLLQIGTRIEIFLAVKHKILDCTRKWMKEFVRQGGLGYLLDALEDLTSKHTYDISETCEILECISCIKAVMNSKNGLEAMVERKECTQKLAKGLYNMVCPICRMYTINMRVDCANICLSGGCYFCFKLHKHNWNSEAKFDTPPPKKKTQQKSMKKPNW